MTDRPDRRRAIIETALANLREHPDLVDKDVDVSRPVRLMCLTDVVKSAVVTVVIEGVEYAVSVTTSDAP